MINISALTEQDKGREVIYAASDGTTYVGQITSWNDFYIFVRYAGCYTSEATRPEDLEFVV